MARRPIARIRQGILHVAGAPDGLHVGSAEWYTWLTTAGGRPFVFESAAGHFTARYEQQRNGRYWYAYRRIDGRLRKTYLGRGEDLSLDLLEAAATRIATTPPLDIPAYLTAKLRSPSPRARHIPRSRLVNRLLEGLHGSLTLLVAPAGSGKTTLLAQSLATIQQTAPGGLRIAWLALDEADNDPARFWLAVGAMLEQLEPGALAALTPLIQTPTPTAERLAAAVLARITHTSDIVLIFDDYHLIHTRLIHDLIELLLDRMPSNLHLVIAARGDPALPLARMRARGQLCEIRAGDLRFSHDETMAFLSETMGLSLSADIVAALDARTEGWAAGLQLAALALRDRADRAEFVAAFSGTNRAIADYLAEEVIGRQSEGIQYFLMATSILKRMCAELCEALLDDRHDSQSPPLHSARILLDDLDRNNLFLVSLDDTRSWYRYHHLFGEMLRDRLQRRYPARVAELHRRAASWHRDHQDLTTAIEHALAAPDYNLAADLIEQTAWSALWSLNEVHTVLDWIDAIPEPTRRSRPWIMILRTWGLLSRVQIAAVEASLHIVEASLEEASPDAAPRALLGELAAIRSYTLRINGNIDGAIETAQRALSFLAPDDLMKRDLVLHNLHHACMMVGDIPGAEAAFGRMRAYAAGAPPSFAVLTSLLTRSWLLKARGRLNEAYDAAQQALDTAARRDIAELPSIGLVHAALAEILYEWNDLEAAERSAHTALMMGARWWNNDIQASAINTLAHIYVARNEHTAARQTYEQMRRLGQEYDVPWIMNQMRATMAQAALDYGDLVAAEHWAAVAGISLSDDPAPVRGGEYLALARLAVVQHRASAALPLLDRLQRQAEAGQYDERLIVVHSIRALAAAQLNRMPEAFEYLQRALEYAAPGGYIRTFVNYGAPMSELLTAYRRILIHSPAADPTRPAHESRLAAIDAILAAFTGARDITATARRARMAADADALTPRERDVLHLLAVGQSSGEIAMNLTIAVSTVQSHIKQIYAKLGVHRRVQAIEHARSLGLI